jgi:IclR family mhp operon transcriptional activator
MLEMTASLVEEDAAGEGSPLRRGHCVSDKKGRLRIFGWRVRGGHQRHCATVQGGGPVIGSLNLIFFTSSMTPEVAASRFLSNMKQAVRDIEQRWSAANKARGKVN